MNSTAYGVVYIIENTVTGMAYIGQTIYLANRWSGHRSLLEQGRHGNQYLQRSWDKHGASAFEFVVIDEATNSDELNETEAFYIGYLRYCGAKLYNCREGGRSARRLLPRPPISNETRQKRSETLKQKGIRPSLIAQERARQASTGRQKTPEEIERWRAANVPQMQTDEYRAAMSQALKGKKKSGYTITDAVRAQWDAKRGQREAPEQTRRRIAAMTKSRPIARFQAPDGSIYETRNIAELARQHGLHERLLHYVASGKQKHHRRWTLVTREEGPL